MGKRYVSLAIWVFIFASGREKGEKRGREAEGRRMRVWEIC